MNADEKAAYLKGKKEWEAAKKATKKNKRAIKGAAEKAGMSVVDADALMDTLSSGELAALAAEIRGEEDGKKLRSLLVLQTRGRKA